MATDSERQRSRRRAHQRMRRRASPSREVAAPEAQYLMGIFAPGSMGTMTASMSGLGSALAALTAMPCFAGLDAAALDRVASGTRIRRFRRGEVVFHLGDPGDALFLISSGVVKITLPSETGEEAILATLQPGEVFGEL